MVARIRFAFPFQFGTVRISSASFVRVERQIESRSLEVEVTSNFPEGVAGQYVSGSPNRLRIRKLLLHECTHAIFDITRTLVNTKEDEAASHVVDALYYRMTGLHRPRWNANLHKKAGVVADALLQNYAEGTRGIPFVDSSSWTEGRNHITSSLFEHGIRVCTRRISSGGATFVPSDVTLLCKHPVSCPRYSASRCPASMRPETRT